MITYSARDPGSSNVDAVDTLAFELKTAMMKYC